MASLIYNSAARDAHVGNIDFDTDAFKVMLVTSAYAENKDTHTKRSDVTNEVTGTGYAAGGIAVGATVSAVDTANDRVDVTFAAVSWPGSTITGARKAVYYKSRGGAATADELVMVVDAGSDQNTVIGTMSLGASIFRVSNPT
jgi:hypothetical protein